MNSNARPSPLASAMPGSTLGDINDVRTIVRMGKTWVYGEIAAGRFPAPVIREHRCARWRMSDVLEWVDTRIANAQQSGGGKRSPATVERAKRASGAAKKARAAKA